MEKQEIILKVIEGKKETSGRKTLGFGSGKNEEKPSKNPGKNRRNSAEISDIIFWKNGNYQKLYTFSTQFSTCIKQL